jgi:hypothetical protein
VRTVEAVNRRKLRIARLAVPIIEAATNQPEDPIVQSILSDVTSLLARDIDQVARLAISRSLGDHRQAILCLTGGVAAQGVYTESLTRTLRKESGIEFKKVVLVEDGADAGAEALALTGQPYVRI